MLVKYILGKLNPLHFHYLLRKLEKNSKNPLGLHQKKAETKKSGGGGWWRGEGEGKLHRKDGTGLGSPWSCSGNKQFVKKCLRPKQCALRVVVSERLGPTPPPPPPKKKVKKWVKKRNYGLQSSCVVAWTGTPVSTHKNKRSTFFWGQITLVQLYTLRLLMDFTTANNLLFPNGGLDSIFHFLKIYILFKYFYFYFFNLKNVGWRQQAKLSFTFQWMRKQAKN